LASIFSGILGFLLGYREGYGSLFKINFQKLLNHFCKEELLENTRVIFIGVLRRLGGEPWDQLLVN
jgi:hypothetical protein